MREVTPASYKVYTFDELSEKAQEKALGLMYDINTDYDWWQCTYEDAENVGLKITGFDIERGNYCNIEAIEDCEAIANEVIKEHGDITDTYKTAAAYLAELEKIDVETDEGEDLLANLNENFLRDMGECYLSMLKAEYEYQTSDEAIKETILCNEYEFLEDGTQD